MVSLGLASCSGDAGRALSRDRTVHADPEPTLAPARPPQLQPLDVPGFEPAVVSVPGSDANGLPLLVAAHGAGDRAEWHCQEWQRRLHNRGFVLCPAGQRTDARVARRDALYYYSDHHALEREIDAAIDALKAKFAARVDTERAVYAGYSQGGIMGALIVAPDAKRFARAALIEGGGAEWNLRVARRFAEDGGSRVLFVCGIAHCQRHSAKAVSYLERTGARAKLIYRQGAGHTYGGVIAQALDLEIEWLLSGDPRWGRDAVR